MKKVIAIVVTYNRKEKLQKNLECLLNQTYAINEILIIDNCSTDNTEKIVKQFAHKNNNIKYIKLNENIGGAGGFAKAIEIAANTDNEYIWGMDDDAFPYCDALENLMIYAEPTKCLWSNCNEDKTFINDLKEVKYWMFVGFFIPVNIVSKIGYPRNDFFIYHDDTEYSNRIIKNKFKIYKVRNSIINHKDTSNQNSKDINIGFIHFKYSYLPDWKLYYFIRNYILKYKWNELKKYKILFYILIKEFIKILFCNRKQIRIFIEAYLDGIFGKSGIKYRP